MFRQLRDEDMRQILVACDKFKRMIDCDKSLEFGYACQNCDDKRLYEIYCSISKDLFELKREGAAIPDVLFKVLDIVSKAIKAPAVALTNLSLSVAKTNQAPLPYQESRSSSANIFGFSFTNIFGFTKNSNRKN